MPGKNKLPRIRLPVVVHQVSITRLGVIGRTRNHPEELPNLAGPSRQMVLMFLFPTAPARLQPKCANGRAAVNFPQISQHRMSQPTFSTRVDRVVG